MLIILSYSFDVEGFADNCFFLFTQGLRLSVGSRGMSVCKLVRL